MNLVYWIMPQYYPWELRQLRKRAIKAAKEITELQDEIVRSLEKV